MSGRVHIKGKGTGHRVGLVDPLQLWHHADGRRGGLHFAILLRGGHSLDSEEVQQGAQKRKAWRSRQRVGRMDSGKQGTQWGETIVFGHVSQTFACTRTRVRRSVSWHFGSQTG